MQHFYAYISRLKYIRRWGLMRNTQEENDMEHSLQVAFIAHGLALYAKYELKKEVDPNLVMALACYHDVSEVITGDLPTPIKYKNEDIKQSYKQLENNACQQLLKMLHKPMRAIYEPYLQPDESIYEWKLVKAADKLCAYIKCLEEVKAGNSEFLQAKKTVYNSILAMQMEEVQHFILHSLDSFGLSLDELSQNQE
ncbi:MAG: 5'-deoxynucleotidase [Eubacteriales bacterium]|nr:5'-deoxynucleotidase [Eubacteriales bacterium]